MNMPIQGTCADIIKHAMVRLHNAFTASQSPAKILMTVHDEIVVECPDDMIDHVSEIMKNTLENIVSWQIPLSVEIGHGKTWRSAK